MPKNSTSHSPSLLPSTSLAMWAVALALTLLPLAFWPYAKDPNIAKPLVLCLSLAIALVFGGMQLRFVAGSPIDWSVIVFAALTAFSWVYSSFRWATTEAVEQMLPYVILYLLLRQLLLDISDTRRIVKAILVGTAILSTIGIAQQLGFLGWNRPWWVGATWFNRTYLAAQLLCVLPLSVWATLSADASLVKLGAVSLALGLSALVFTGATIAWVGAIPVILTATAASLLLMGEKQRLRAFRLLALIVILFCVCDVTTSCLFPSYSLSHRLQSALSPTDASNTGRLEFSTAAIEFGVKRPCLGYGAGTFGIVAPEYMPKSYWRVGDFVVKHAHNEFLQVFAELGALGLLAFLAMPLTAVLATVRIIRASQSSGFAGNAGVALAAMTGIAGFLIANLVGISARVPGGMGLFYACLAVVASSTTPVSVKIGQQEHLTWKRNTRTIANIALCGSLVVLALSLANQGKTSAHLLMGETLLQSKDCQTASHEFEEACRMMPRNPEALYDLGNSYALAGRDADAILIYKRVAGLAPDYARLHYNQGIVCLRMGLLKQAALELEKAYAIDGREDSHSLLVYANDRWRKGKDGRQ